MIIYVYDREIGHIKMFITSVSICLHFSGYISPTVYWYNWDMSYTHGICNPPQPKHPFGVRKSR